VGLDLKDIRCKVDPATHAFLSGEATGRGVDICEVIREVLDSWRAIRHAAHIATQKRLQAEGLAGESQGSAGQAGNQLKW
jgi:hypothetical protein